MIMGAVLRQSIPGASEAESGAQLQASIALNSPCDA